MPTAVAHLGPTPLVLLALSAIALLLLLILKARLHPFVALLLVSILVALAAGVAPADLASTIEAGMGKTLGHVGLIIPLGAMIGRIIEHSGGAALLANQLIARCGERRTPLALTIAGFLIGMPIFFEVGVIMLMPMAYAVARKADKPLLIFALPMCIALLVVHAFLPPHPGPVAAAALLGADVGLILMWGIPVSAVTTAVAYWLAGLINRRRYSMSDEIRLEVYGPTATVAGSPAVREHTSRDLPEVKSIAALILLPIVLIMLGTVATVLPLGNVSRQIMTVLGTPFVALLLDVLLCAYVLGIRGGWSRGEIADVVGAAIPGVAMVVMITGAGGIFANVLVVSGIGNAISGVLRSSGLPVLGLAFILTLLLRAAQGPTTVALITTAGIIGPLITQAQLTASQLALVCLAMGAGGLAVSHVNDAGFWFVTRLTGLNVGEGFRSWTLLTTATGLVGFLLIVSLWYCV